MPLIPGLVERLLFLKLNQAPSALIDIFAGTGLRVVVLGSDLGIFDALEEGPASVLQLADRLDLNSAGLAALLPVLESFGYVSESEGVYSNTRQTSSWLLTTSPNQILNFLRWWNDIVYRYWDGYMEASMRAGDQAPDLYTWISDQPNGWEIAQAGIEAIARLTLDDVVQRVKIHKGWTELLDVGGGHALYSIELSHAHPSLKATVFDFPDALGRAKKNIQAANLGQRMRVRGGDYLHDDLGGPYDVALLFNVVHAHDGRENQALMRRIANCLKPNGHIFIMDQMEEPSLGPVSTASFRILGLAYHVGLDGRLFNAEEVSTWLKQAGFVDVSQTELRKAPGTIIVGGSKSDGTI